MVIGVVAALGAIGVWRHASGVAAAITAQHAATMALLVLMAASMSWTIGAPHSDMVQTAVGLHIITNYELHAGYDYLRHHYV